MLSKWEIVDLKFLIRSLLDTSSFWSDSDVLIDLALPHEIEVEFSIVSNSDLLSLSFVDKEFSKVKYIRLSSTDLLLLLVSEHSVVDLVTFSFDIENKWSCLSLDVTGKVVVI